MPYVTNLSDFDGVLTRGSTGPAAAKRIAKFMTEIVEIVSREGQGSIRSGVPCFKRPNRRACTGSIVAIQEVGTDDIHWECPACAESGVIRDWRHGSADLSHLKAGGAARETSGSPFIGRWRITEMEMWAEDALQLMGTPFFHFESEDGMGQFRFIAVVGGLHCAFSARDGRPFVEFSWEGDDDGDPRCGRGWASIAADGTLNGRFFFHLGDGSSFTARRETAEDRRPRLVR